MSKVDTVYKWLADHIFDEVWVCKKDSERVTNVSKETKDGESKVSLVYGKNEFMTDESRIMRVHVLDDANAMVVILNNAVDENDESEIKSNVLVFSTNKDFSYFDYIKQNGFLPTSENDESLDEEIIYKDEEEGENGWPTKEFKNEFGDTFTCPIVRVVGNPIVQNYINNNTHGRLGLVYFNEKYGFGNSGPTYPWEKHGLIPKSERLTIVTEDDEEFSTVAPRLVLNDNEEVRVLTPTWAVDSEKPAILCAKGTDNDRFIIYPRIDYPTPLMGTLVEIERQFDDLFNFKHLGADVTKYDDIHNECMDMLVGAIKSNPKCYDGEKDTRNILESEATKLEERAKQIREGLPDTPIDNGVTPQSKLKTLVSDFIKDKKIVLGEEMADDEDKEEIAECIADGGACLEEAEDKLGELCKALAEHIKDSGIGAVHFYNDGDKVSCDVTLHFEY